MSGLLPSRKVCPDCGLEKNAAEFGRNKRRADGLAQYCKECFRRRSKASYRKRMAERGKQVRERPEVPEGFRYCPQCDEIRSLSAFGSNRSTKDGLATYCRPCHNRVMAANKVKNHGSERSYLLKYRFYGLTEDEVAGIVDRQASLCLICLRARPLHVDHDHVTGEVRGLICFPCNGALGQFRDVPAVIRGAVDYLERQSTSAGRAVHRTARGKRASHREAHLFRRYGIGEGDFERLVGQQEGLCPVCREASPTVVDHDHVTAAVRGILCGDCNTGMGQLDDNPWLLRRAIEYLTGGLSGLRRDQDGRFEVTVVRPRRDGPVTDPGWEIGQIGGHDLAVLHAFARDDSGDPWEFDVDVAGPGPIEPRFPVLDLSDLRDDAPRPAEYAFL